jgi:hypothetical protein
MRGNVSEYMNRQQGGNTTNIHMTGVYGNNVIASNNVVQNTASRLDMCSLLDFAGFVRQVSLRLGLPEEQQKDLEEKAEELHSVCQFA